RPRPAPRDRELRGPPVPLRRVGRLRGPVPPRPGPRGRRRLRVRAAQVGAVERRPAPSREGQRPAVTRLAGKTAIVTGASANIGGALARGLAAEGARVVCTDLAAGVAESTARVIRDAGGEAFGVRGDVTDPEH